MLSFNDFGIPNFYNGYCERSYFFAQDADIGLRSMNLNPICTIHLTLDNITRYNEEIIIEFILYIIIFLVLLRSNNPPNLKRFCMAMVLHKIKMLQYIMDLSFNLNIGKHIYKFINNTTTLQTKSQSILQLGRDLCQILVKMNAQEDSDSIFSLTKLDIKDRF